MRLDALLIADAATAADGKLFIHGGGITRINPSRFPWGQSLAFVIHLVLDADDDPGATHTLAIELRDPAGNHVIPAGAHTLPPVEVYKAVPGEVLSYAIAATYTNVVFPQEGLYEVRVLVDGVQLRDFPLPAVYSPVPS